MLSINFALFHEEAKSRLQKVILLLSLPIVPTPMGKGVTVLMWYAYNYNCLYYTYIFFVAGNIIEKIIKLSIR